MIDHGGFEGNGQTLRILTRLEKKATKTIPSVTSISQGEDVRLGLNLTARTLASVLKYDRRIPSTEIERKRTGVADEPVKGYYKQEIPIVMMLKEKIGVPNNVTKKFKTIECSIMDVADDIAYSTYDIEDAFAAKFLNPISILAVNDTTKQNIMKRIQKKIDVTFPDLSEGERKFDIDDLNRGLATIFFGTSWGVVADDVGDLDEGKLVYIGSEIHRFSQYMATSPYLRTEFTSELIGLLVRKIEVIEDDSNPIFWTVRPKIDAFTLIESLKQICFTQLIETDRFLAEKHRAKHILGHLFHAIKETGSSLLPPDWREIYEYYRDDSMERSRAICDFLSGMTNRYAVEFHNRLFGYQPPSIHKP